ncbi:uncharacterized protein LOC101219596 [Cucumis sativus]|uniref:Uncharacterized protein n=1 Tax=Cucumis sativus TaxID=3659 RepID=A0A0A0L2U7_CUCSA|nr:uncharacterized protein LOC101219596 [Cucumis sativus]XP_011650492.1 uncharacterized protein LOC101219596 [Cucumis sativus]KGN56048.1 hypothetical protein Csa_010603 [Cucumis sativus]
MAETKDSTAAHIVEIPVEQENHTQNLMISVIQHHPLRQISESSGHLLLLKLWQRDEHLFGLRIGRRETKMESLKQQIFQLCCFFFLFHALSLTLLYTSSDPIVCKKWWVPAVVIGATSGVFVIVVQLKLWMYWKARGQLQKEKTENRALTRCVQELRMKGSCFNLSKEPQIGNRMKSSSVEIKWGPLTWFSRNFITISLLGFSAIIFVTSKFILCGF